MRLKLLTRLTRLEWVFLLAIALVGVVMRIEAQSHLQFNAGDGVPYCYHAINILNGVERNFLFERRGPFFQLLLTMSYTIFGVSFESSVLVPQVFSCITPILFFLLGKRFFDSKTGLIAALLSALNPMFINVSCFVMRETLALFLILTIILVSYYVVTEQTKRKYSIATILLGFLSGLLILTREEMLFIILPSIIIYLYFTRRPDFKLKVSILLIIALLTIAPWLFYSAIHFGDPLFSYTYYIEIPSVTQRAGSTGSYFPSLLTRLLFGLWTEISMLQPILSLIGFVFLPIGILFSVRKRPTWIILVLVGVDMLVLSYFLRFQDLPYKLQDANRIILSAVMPTSLLSAYGIRKITLPIYEKAEIKAKALVLLSLVIFGAIALIPPQIAGNDGFDEKTAYPFILAAVYLNATDSQAKVYTMYPDLLAKYYKGPIYQTPIDDFNIILEEAKNNDVRYLVIDTTNVCTSIDLSDLTIRALLPYYQVYPYERIPSEFILVDNIGWVYGIYLLNYST